MSTHFTDIYGALRTRLNSISGVPPIAWENINYTPSSTTLYLRPTLIPAPTNQASLGDNGLDINNGLFQVDVFIPDNKGRSTWPDTICDSFKRGTVLTQNSINVRIVSASLLTAVKDGNFFIVPVSIRWQAFTPARS